MALFQQKQDFSQQVIDLRNQGLTDNLIVTELGKQGIPPDQVHATIAQMDGSASLGQPVGSPEVPAAPDFGASPGMSQQGMQPQDNIYDRIEEITEGIVDQRWDELIIEVKKILEWKQKVEDAQRKIENDVVKLKEDFKVLHTGVLGKLESYDERMSEVGSELKAVGKVFKDVVPVFVENVKELKHHVEKHKKH
ncbi:hypothetical protein HOD05_04400 [Candidatus Woesearchaeota archaeon]|jgi:hypothetical protein|nr:hypothetical protein [Candidatus Woesearchaeota archaeon]MBT4151191.1 hypothetical protein [Candidatus Woesearchaeota archaeon]MBT4247267.1 hypothetical protein [Candidatus Woesearchaeota archaeon]MBT4434434.1 hypothetical protein [Candidatus Woesearchaeota archaeon]MBT7332667.1 hypothetical protein [Candidatus Woesearchaeota archaeon]